MKMTLDQVNAHEARLAERRIESPSSQSDFLRESKLHEQILAECARRQWIVFHGSMAHKTFRTKGEPDFVILADGQRLFLIEGKSASGKLSPEQAAIAAWANRLNHKIHVIRSFAEFIDLIDQTKLNPVAVELGILG